MKVERPNMIRSTHNPWLHRFAVLTVLATFVLLGVGGVVTSKGVGMAVPDWPTSYGYNMFALPFKFWKGGALFEHAHRLVASGVGFLTTILAVWLWLAEARRWLRWLGVIAFVSVVIQGVLGGLRVVLFKDEIGIFHAALAQLFLALVCAIALFTSRWWERRPPARRVAESQAGDQRAVPEAGAPLRWWFLGTTILIFLQLVLGATMRHQHAGLAISDFPLAHGKLWPAMDEAAIQNYNARRLETTAANPITAFQIGLHMAHRLMALAILVCVGSVAWRAWRIGTPSTASARTERDRQRAEAVLGAPLRRLAFLWLALILIQIGLGAWTIWSNKAADVATAHVLVGALSLVTGVVGCIICFRRFARVVSAQGAPVSGSPRTHHPATVTN